MSKKMTTRSRALAAAAAVVTSAPEGRTTPPPAPAAAAAASSPAVRLSPPPAPARLPSTERPCRCGDAAAHHVPLPHLEESFWRLTVARMTPLADFWSTHVRHAQRVGETGSAPEANNNEPAAASSASAASTSSLDSEDDPCIWRRHYAVLDASSLPSPLPATAACLDFLRTTRHPSSGSTFTGRSLAHTLDTVLDALDRAHFLRVVVPSLAHRVLQLPSLFPPRHCLPQLRQDVDASVTLSAEQCACIFACQFFSLFATREENAASWPNCNMDEFFSVMRAPMSGKHVMMMNYAARIENTDDCLSSRFVTFHRRVLSSSSFTSASLSSDSTPLSPVSYHASGCIEEAPHTLQADFANAYIGGGVLYTGCVQEEIRFCMSPECIVSMVLCESMMDHEAIVLIGTEQFSSSAGYALQLRFGADFKDDTPRDEFGRIANCIIAIDAVDYCHNNGSERRSPLTQWRTDAMQREIEKAYVGFSVPQEALGEKIQYTEVATGNWGCGAFGGFVPLKFLLQWIASSRAGRAMQYFSFGDALARSIPSFLAYVAEDFAEAPLTVGEMWQAVQIVAADVARRRQNEWTHDEMLQDVAQELREARDALKASSEQTE